jgi:hypothetical protein
LSIHQKLLEIIDGTERHFVRDELAYLAVTSKIEGPLRDYIAFQLHLQLGNELLVNREWALGRQRIDIAVTDHENCKRYLIELKAHSLPSFQQELYVEGVKDLRRLYQAADADSELYFGYFVNHVKASAKIPERFRQAIKYWPYLNRDLEAMQFPADIRDSQKRDWLRHLELMGLPNEHHVTKIIQAGNYYDLPVIVFAHLYGPMRKADLEGVFE